MNLHDVLLEMADQHLRVNKKGFSDLLFFNHITKSISNGQIILVKNGNIIPQKIKLSNGVCFDLEDNWGLNDEEFYSGLEKRFEKFFLSTPSKSERFVRSIFQPKPIKDYTYADVINATNNRAIARYELEWFLMYHSVNGNISWNDKHWFWQSEKCTKLVLLKKYI